MGIAFDEETNTLTVCCLCLMIDSPESTAPDRIHDDITPNYLYYSYREA